MISLVSTDTNRYNEANFDRAINDGCVFYKLILNAFPNHFNKSSIYAHCPLVVPTENMQIMQSLKRVREYTWGRPVQRTDVAIIHSSKTCADIVEDNEQFQGSFDRLYDAVGTTKAKRQLQVVTESSSRLQTNIVTFCEENTNLALSRFGHQKGTSSAAMKVDIVAEVISRTTTLLVAELFSLKPCPKAKVSDRIHLNLDISTVLARSYDVCSSNPSDLGSLRQACSSDIAALIDTSRRAAKRVLASPGFLTRLLKKPQNLSATGDYGASLITELAKDEFSIELIVQEHL